MIFSSQLLIALLILALLVLAGLLIVRIVAGVSVFWALRFPRGWGSRRDMACRKCKYDLQASPDYCPECGTKVQPMVSTLIRYRMRIQQLDDIKDRLSHTRKP